MPQSLTVSLSRSVAAIEVAPGRFDEIPSDFAPSDEDRKALTVRQEILIPALRGAGSGGDIEAVKRRIGKLFSMLAMPRADEEASLALVCDYAKLLSSQPLWAIDAACLEVLNGGATFRPSAPSMLAMAKKACEGAKVELASINRLLNAKVYKVNPPEDRKRILAKLREFSETLGSDRNRKLTKEQAEANLSRLSESEKPPLTVGPHLAEYLKRKPFVGQSSGAEDYGEIR